MDILNYIFIELFFRINPSFNYQLVYIIFLRVGHQNLQITNNNIWFSYCISQKIKICSENNPRTNKNS